MTVDAGDFCWHVPRHSNIEECDQFRQEQFDRDLALGRKVGTDGERITFGCLPPNDAFRDHEQRLEVTKTGDGGVGVRVFETGTNRGMATWLNQNEMKRLVDYLQRIGYDGDVSERYTEPKPKGGDE